jgi:hypothetical protein
MTEEREYSVHLRTPHEKQAEFLNSHAKRIVIRAGRHEGVARQVREEGRIAPLKGFVRQFLGLERVIDPRQGWGLPNGVTDKRTRPSAACK